jgi:hypothetical protein
MVIVQELSKSLPFEYAAGPLIHLGSVLENRDVPSELPGQDKYEIRIHARDNYRTVFSTLQLVSASNKDSPGHVEAFVSKCFRQLDRGIAVAIVDIVTEPSADLFGELWRRLGKPRPHADREASQIFAAVFRPVRADGDVKVDYWDFPLAIGKPLPTIPVWLQDDAAILLDLERTYEETCRVLRID